MDTEETWASIDNISHPLVKEFAAYWSSLRKGRRVPARRDFEPFDAKRFLPHLFLLDVERPAMRFKGRVVGTRIAETLGYDYTGKYLDAVVSEPYYTQLKQDLTSVAEEGILHYRLTTLDWNDKPYSVYSRLYAPLTTNTDQIDIVVGIAIVTNSADIRQKEDLIRSVLMSQRSISARIVLPE